MLKENYLELKKSGVLDWWKKGYRGQNVTVLVLDDEGDRHPWLDDKITTLFDNHEGVGHNTNVTQVIREVGSESNIIMANFFGKDSKKREIIDWIKANTDKIDLINISYSSDNYDYYKEIEATGIPVICSSGNAGNDDGVHYPAKLGFTIAVGALYAKKDYIASYSNGGKELDCVEYSGTYVRSITKRIFPFEGTSAASPFATGMAAILISYLKSKGYKKPNGEELRKYIHDNCMDLREEGFDYKSGYGRFVLSDLEKINFDKYFVKEGEKVNKPEKIILHHSFTKDGKVVDYDAIKRYHTETKGWNDIGYHYLIEKVGDKYKVIPGRDEKTIGAHTKGENSRSIGICIVGNFDEYEPNHEQIKTLFALIKNIYNRYGELPIHGHNEFSSKTCPGTKFPLKELRDLMNKDTKEIDLTNVSDWAKKAWVKAVKKGINDGEGPKDNITEEQLMVFFDRAGLLD